MRQVGILVAVAACSREPVTVVEREVVFVRGGWITDAGVEGQSLADGRRLVRHDWRSGQSYEVAGRSVQAPVRAQCVDIFQVDLGDVQRHIAAGGPAPNTSLAWSPTGGDRLAVGSYRGEVMVLDGWSGEVQARRRFAETMIKHVRWSADGKRLYAAEQSPDAMLYALDSVSLEVQWSLRLADRVGSSAAPAGEDIYGVYQLPAAYGLEVLDDGSVVTSALHSWTDDEGVARNLSQVLRVSESGEVLAAWPAAPADATLKHPVVGSDTVAVVVGRSADGPPPDALPIGGVQVLTLDELRPVRSESTPPLLPWFSEASIWEALDIDADSGRLMMGFADGRVRIVSAEGELVSEISSGTPVLAGSVPIHAGVGWGQLVGDDTVFLTARTRIPWGTAAPETRPPSAHPSENALWVYGSDGELAWSWSGAHELAGLSVRPDGGELVVGASERQVDDRRDLYGALVFDLTGARQRAGDDRLTAICPTEGPVFFRHAVAADGRIAVAEHPYVDREERTRGAYRVTVLR